MRTVLQGPGSYFLIQLSDRVHDELNPKGDVAEGSKGPKGQWQRSLEEREEQRSELSSFA